MNTPSLLQIVERLERLAGRLPSKIRKAVLNELTPLKQLFLQQRPPRFLFAGSAKVPARKIISALFGSAEFVAPNTAAPLCRWFDVDFPERGKISIIDARGVDDSAAIHVRDELKYRAADIIFFIRDERIAQEMEKRELGELNSYLSWNETLETDRKIIEIIVPPYEKHDLGATRDEHALESSLVKPGVFLETLRLIPVDNNQGFELPPAEARRLMSILARELPNEARMEMIRISRDQEAQREVAQLLVKSTTAVSAAIGAQPIPLADLPILTSLQLTMISGIMYVSGRERSLRAAAEFAGALGANVGAAMLLREGARAILKFFPGWGNVVCGLVAGSGTYAIGRAATAFFIEGVSLKDARRTYLANRKRRRRRES
ncbi:MAG: hypothetical protein DMF36_06415 [Verrucomicrobia bacterium]|nr:MAG: hypothetical protein AUI00_04190 [Verrucomicrobia bacterium 13_2_20CM_2_54_15]OLD74183.1 MAG: hypothetical protein AUF68_01205 [Verrucomicrobia bacterium 13_1_20CM_54_28]PYK15586.1 MAG: hypothetical protein DME64_06375 [Verrucomicrobiota bacterium]PYL39053.1 MAG: hypothetical protein DMF36_06415 [Verrucomicrobiota bacterium]